MERERALGLFRGPLFVGSRVIELAHWSAVAPIAFLLIWRRNAPGAAWLIALGFLASYFADSLADALSGSWVVSYLLPPVQFGLFAAAFQAYWVIFALLVLAAYQISGPMDGPDVLLTVAGSVAVLMYAVGQQFGLAMALYCGAGTALYIVLATGLWTEAFMPTWYAYQGVRVLAFAVFCGSLREVT